MALESLAGQDRPLQRDFSRESVTEGLPDKIADYISGGVVDAIIKAAPRGRVAGETLVKTGLAIVAGEVTTRAYADIPKIVRSRRDFRCDEE